MNLALDRFADNPIIDELVSWPPRRSRMVSVRACNVLFRKPFIEIACADGDVIQRHFPRDGFAEFWAEACVILETLTSIRLISEFRFTPVDDRGALSQRALDVRRECIAEAEPMFEHGMYAQYAMQFGEDCKDLPAEVEGKLAQARRLRPGG